MEMSVMFYKFMAERLALLDGKAFASVFKEVTGQPLDVWMEKEAAAEQMKSKTKTVGNIVTADTIMSYSLSYGHVVTVTGKQDAERDLWEFAGVIDGKVVMRGEVMGGKWRASTYLKFIRNGLLSRARRHKVNPVNGKEGAAAAEVES